MEAVPEPILLATEIFGYITAVVSLLCSCTIVYVVRCHSVKEMDVFKWYIALYSILCALFDTLIAVCHPEPVMEERFYMTGGLLKYIGASDSAFCVIVALIMFLFMMILGTLLSVFVYRYYHSMDIPRICGVLPYDKVLYFVLAYLSILFVVLVLWFNRATTAPSLVKTGMSATVPDLFAAVRDRAIFSLA
ncbi:hypothetical protein AAVH_22234, partial [Aphelenchoides avenae]